MDAAARGHNVRRPHLAIVWIAQMMNPSARRAKSGFTQAQPTSTLNAVYGHMRVMRDCSRHRPDTRIMRDTLKGLCAQYKQIFGNDAFVPQRAQPFALRHLLEMAGLLADNQVVGWASPKQAAMLAMCTHRCEYGSWAVSCARGICGEACAPSPDPRLERCSCTAVETALGGEGLSE